MRSAALMILFALSTVTAPLGCGGRSMGSPNDSPDGGAPPDGQVVPPDPCEPMDAFTVVDETCLDERPLGWAWDGAGCHAVWCECGGADCDRLVESEGLCWAAYAPECLSGPPCLAEPYESCLERADCQIVYYGGGCIDVDDCSNTGPDGNWLCWEQGIACVPADHPCTQRARGECDGDCYWWERTNELCFESCCIDESYGYCAPVPGTEDDCSAQEIGFCSDPCVDTVGWRWDGAFCRPVTCCCEGPDCSEMYATREACVEARLGCSENTCAAGGGYCEYGDYVEPSCAAGYYRDDELNAAEPGVCGMGVCCTPCEYPDDPDIWWAGRSPAECAMLDWDCFDPEWVSFQNDCGCGCYIP